MYVRVCELVSERVCQLYFIYLFFRLLRFFHFLIFLDFWYIRRIWIHNAQQVLAHQRSQTKDSTYSQRWSIFPTPAYPGFIPPPCPIHSFVFFLFNLYLFLLVVFFFFLFFTHLLSIYVQIAGTYVYKQALRHRRRTPTVSR